MGLAGSGSAERPSASSRREEEAMSRHIVDDEQRGNHPQPPCGWAASGPRSLWVPAARGHLHAGVDGRAPSEPLFSEQLFMRLRRTRGA